MIAESAQTALAVAPLVEVADLSHVYRDAGSSVTALHEVSHDPSCTHLMTLKDGRKITAVQLQVEYLEQARKYTFEVVRTLFFHWYLDNRKKHGVRLYTPQQAHA